MPHTVEEAADFMSKLDDLMGPSFSSAPDGAENRLGSTNPIASTETDEKLVLKSVSATDGSAAISTSTKVKYLIVYFAFNLGLTLYNKAIMIAVCGYANMSFCLLLYSILERFCRSTTCVVGNPTVQGG